MRFLIALAAASVAITATASVAEAQNARNKRQRDLVVKVSPRTYLDAGTQAPPGVYQNYSLGPTPFRSSDAIVPTGSAQQRLLPGQFGTAW